MTRLLPVVVRGGVISSPDLIHTLPVLNLIPLAALPRYHPSNGVAVLSVFREQPKIPGLFSCTPVDCPAEDTGCMYTGLAGLANCAKSILLRRPSFPTTPHIARQGLTTLNLKSLPKDRRQGVVVSTGLEGDGPGFRSWPLTILCQIEQTAHTFASST